MLLDLQAASAEAAVRGMHERLALIPNAVVDGPRFLADVLARMRLAPVCIGDDVALPHARSDAVTRLVIAVARLAQPVAFDAQHPRIQLVILIGTPKAEVSRYLQVVAALSRRLKQAGTRSGLYTARDEAEFRTLLSGGAAARR